jgi:hypothetical protein
MVSRWRIAAALTGLLFSTIASGQSGCAGTGSIDGVVSDPSGAAVVGAEVEAGNGLAAVSDASGRYILPCVAPGSLTLVVEAGGFGLLTVGAEVQAGQAAHVDLHLAIAAVQQDVQVSAETADPGVGDALVLGTEQVQQLADDPDDFLRQLEALASASGGGVGSAMIRVDGFQNAGALPPKGSIASIRVNPDLFSSEYEFPPFGGAQIEITTKPGAEKMHGALFYTDSDGSFNARDAFSTVATPAGKRRYGFELSGPIVAKKSGYSLALEKRDIDEFNVVNAVTLGSDGEQAPLRDTVSAPQRLWEGLARADWQWRPADVAVLSFSANRNNIGNMGVGGLTLAEAGYTSLVSEYDLRFSNTQTLSSRAVHESRVGYSWKRSAATPNSTSPSVQVAGFFTAGGATRQQLSNGEGDLEVDDDLLLTSGTHDWKLGLQSLDLFVRDTDPDTFNGAYIFGGGSAPVLDANGVATAETTSITGLEQYQRALKNLPGGTATTYQLTAGTALIPVNEYRLALYAEDSWKVMPALTASMGVRYNFDTTPGSYKNVDPRLSLAWALDKKRRWILHLRGGLFSIPVPVADSTEVARLNDIQQRETTLYGAAFVADGNSPSLNAGGLQISTVKEFARGYQQQSTFNGIIHVEHEFPGHWLVEPGLYFAEDWHTPLVPNINAPMVASSVGTPPDPSAALLAPRPIAPNENIFQYQNGGHLLGNLESLSVKQNGYKWIDLSIWYGHFHFKANNGDWPVLTSPQSTYSKLGESSRVNWLAANKVSALGTFKLPYKVDLTTVFESNGGLPYNITTGTDSNGDGSFNDRPSYAVAPGSGVYSTRYGLLTANTVNGNVPRNLGTMPAVVHLDLSVGRTFVLNAKSDRPLSLGFTARSANLLNHTNVTAVSSILSSASFSQAIAAETARRVELGMRFSF